jgi:hypothetical protein
MRGGPWKERSIGSAPRGTPASRPVAENTATTPGLDLLVPVVVYIASVLTSLLLTLAMMAGVL